MTAVSEDVILLDDTLTETFLTDLQSRGRTEETLKCYRNSLGKLCGFLPGRRLSHDAMRCASRATVRAPSTARSPPRTACSPSAGGAAGRSCPPPCPRPSSPS